MLLLLLPTATLFALAVFYDTFPGDDALLRVLRIYDEPLRGFFAWFDISPVASLSMTGFLLGVCLVRRSVWDSLTVLLVLPAQGLVIVLPKLFLGRPRPEGALAGATDSFPSGTAATAILVLGLAIYFVGLYVTQPRLRIALQGVLVLAVAALGVFRLLAGEHYPSDVLGGWLGGALALVVLVGCHRRMGRGMRAA